MNFLYPGFLWALAALAVPVLIHLFWFRRYRTVYFSNVRHLREVVEETETRNRLKHLLVLLARMLALAFLVLAFAQPLLPGDEEGGDAARRAVSIYMDNSFSMDALGEDRSLLEEARERARRIALAYAETDRFQLITNDLEGRHQRLVGREEFLEWLDEIALSPRSPGLDRVFGRQRDALRDAGPDVARAAYLVSDFQTSMAEEFEPDTAVRVTLVPLAGVEQRNLAVDTAWFDAPVQVEGASASLHVRIRNHGESDAEAVGLKLSVEGEVKAISEASVPARGVVEDTMSFTVTGSGWRRAELTITDYPVTFDDTWYFSFEVAREVPVLSIGGPAVNPFLERMFATGNLFRLDHRPAGGVDYAALGGYRLIVLDGLERVSSGLAAELRDYLEAGGNVVVFPSMGADADSYNAFLSSVDAARLDGRIERRREVATLNAESPVFRDVFEDVPENMALPTAKRSWRLAAPARAREDVLLRFRDGTGFFGRYPAGLGSLYLCASPLDPEATDLPVQGGVIVPILFKVAMQGAADRPTAYVIGRDDWIPVDGWKPDGDEAQPRVRFGTQPGEQLEFLPRVRTFGNRTRIQVADQVIEAGHYDVAPREEGGDPVRFSMNYDRRESRMSYLDADDLKDRYGRSVRVLESGGERLAAEVGRYAGGRGLWKVCLILALAFLMVEILLIRLL